MPRGRKADPAAVKAAKGNPGKRRIVDVSAAEVAAVIGKVTPPAHLSKEAREMWLRYAPELERLNFLRASDAPAFARYCEGLAQFWKATRALRKEPTVYWTETPHGKMRRLNPWFMVQDRLDRRLLALEDRFGINPAARQSIMYRLAQAPAPNATLDLLDNGIKEPGDSEGVAESPVGFLN